MAVHSFERKAAESRSPRVRTQSEKILHDKLEAKRFRWTDEGDSDDRHGVDVFALLPNNKEVGVDIKDNKYGEVRLEYVSRRGEGIIGWTVDDAKRSDYILNLWPGRHWLIDFPSLKAIAKLHKDWYLKHYALKAAESKGRSGDWQTLFVPVPVGILLSHIYGETVMGTPLTAPRLCPSCNLTHPVGTTCGSGWA